MITYRENGKSRKESVGYVSQVVADARYGEIRKAQAEGRVIEKKKSATLLFKDLAETYIQWAPDHLEFETVRSHRNSIKILNKHFGSLVADTITTPQCEAFRQRRLRMEKAAKNTINNNTSTMSAIFTFGKRMGLVSNHPLKGLVRYSVAPTKDRIYTKRELAAALASAPEHFYPLLYGYFQYGMRNRELLSIRRNKFNPTTGVRQSYVDFENELFAFWNTKTERERIVAITAPYLKILKAIPRSFKPEAKDFLFLNHRGDRTKESNTHGTRPVKPRIKTMV